LAPCCGRSSSAVADLAVVSTRGQIPLYARSVAQPGNLEFWLEAMGRLFPRRCCGRRRAVSWLGASYDYLLQTNFYSSPLCPTKRCSEREPADSLRDKFNVSGGWLRSLTLCVKRMKVTRYKFKLGLGLLFAVFGLGFTVASIYEFLGTRPHGLGNFYEFVTVGPLLLLAGLGFCFDKDDA